MNNTILTISKKLDSLVSKSLAEPWDNVGLIVGEPQNKLTGILVALDITEQVLQEAMDQDLNLIVTHHPIWFRERKTLINEDFSGKQIQTAIKNDLSLYAFHTNLDHYKYGVNHKIIQLLGLEKVDFLKFKPGFDSNSATPAGSGMIGNLKNAMAQNDFLQLVKECFRTSCIRYSPGSQTISRVAVCGGAGSFLIEAAMKAGADAYLTGDITYHNFFDTMDNLLLMDIGHYESEQFTVDVIYDLLCSEISDIKIIKSKINTNPIKYFI